MIAALLAAVAIAVYVYAAGLYNTRFPDRAYSGWRIAAFVSGVVLMTAVLLPPVEPLADQLFAWHMTQHVVLMLVGRRSSFWVRRCCLPLPFRRSASRGASRGSHKALSETCCSRRSPAG